MRVLNFGRFFSASKSEGRLICGLPYKWEYMVYGGTTAVGMYCTVCCTVPLDLTSVALVPSPPQSAPNVCNSLSVNTRKVK